MENNVIKKVQLENGLLLAVLDDSKKVAGDRWLVKLRAKVDIPVRDYLGDEPEQTVQDILETLGPCITYEKCMERNFIDTRVKESLFNEFCEAILKNSARYLSTPKFPRQFIIKKYREYKQRKNWYPDGQL